MERVYFSINEAGAKTANDMMSFSEYNNNGKYAVERVIRELEEMEAAE